MPRQDIRNFPKKMFKFEKYDDSCRLLFQKERRRLSLNLGKDFVIEHIGSSAVPGLGGKNILDIIVGFRRASPRKLKTCLEALGYTFVDDPRSGRLMFFYKYRRYGRKVMRIHMHVTRYGSEYWRERIALRDYLRNHRDKALEYQRIKEKAAKAAKGSKSTYKRIKGRFIQTELKKAKEEALRPVEL